MILPSRLEVVSPIGSLDRSEISRALNSECRYGDQFRLRKMPLISG